MPNPTERVEEFHDFDDDLIASDSLNDDELFDPETLCGMMPDGLCGQAGSEYCDFECPYRD